MYASLGHNELIHMADNLKAFIRTNADPIHRHIYASLGVHELIHMIPY